MMRSMAIRIRRARITTGMTQTALAAAVGVRRSAVAQWESLDGTLPSIEHLYEISVKTGFCFEWRATGRGPIRVDDMAVDEGAAVLMTDIAKNAAETRMLELLRRLPTRKQEMVCEIVELLGAR